MSAPAKTEGHCDRHPDGPSGAFDERYSCTCPRPTSPASAVAEAIGIAIDGLGDGLIAAATEARDLRLENERLRGALNRIDYIATKEWTSNGDGYTRIAALAREALLSPSSPTPSTSEDKSCL